MLSQIPNAITVLRALLVAPFVLALLNGRTGLALVVFLVAGASDGLDGYLAKHYGWQSRVGAILDPLADKVLLVSAYLTLAWVGLLPAWLAAVVVARDVIIVLGALIYHAAIAPYDLRPSASSKLNTLAQLLLVVLVVLDSGWWALPTPLLSMMVYVVLVTTVWSGVGYVVTWGRRAWQARRDGGARP